VAALAEILVLIALALPTRLLWKRIKVPGRRSAGFAKVLAIRSIHTELVVLRYAVGYGCSLEKLSFSPRRTVSDRTVPEQKWV